MLGSFYKPSVQVLDTCCMSGMQRAQVEDPGAGVLHTGAFLSLGSCWLSEWSR